MILTGRVLTITSVSLLFLAYSNFAPNALTSDIVPYLKNHLIREFVFGVSLTVFTIYLATRPPSYRRCHLVFLVGSIVVLPFWIGAAFGFVTQGMEQAWQGNADSTTAYLLHGPQVVLFYCGCACLYIGTKRTTGLKNA